MSLCIPGVLVALVGRQFTFLLVSTGMVRESITLTLIAPIHTLAVDHSFEHRLPIFISNRLLIRPRRLLLERRGRRRLVGGIAIIVTNLVTVIAAISSSSVASASIVISRTTRGGRRCSSQMS